MAPHSTDGGHVAGVEAGEEDGTPLVTLRPNAGSAMIIHYGADATRCGSLKWTIRVDGELC